jgi:hypothetical protein
VLVVLGALAAAACGGDDDPARAERGAPSGDDIVDWIEQPGDQVITVPDGTYRAGDVHAPHEATNGRYGGWLVLQAESQHGVVVDLEGRELRLDDDTSRVAFIGFRFVNGSVRALGHDLAFWYTDHTFPADEWADQAPDRDEPEEGYYRAPRTVYANESSVNRVSFYGSDLHDTGTAITISNSHDVLLEGVHIWALSDKGVDPQDVVHADAIGGVGGGSEGLTVRDSWIQGRVILKDSVAGEGGGPHEDFVFEDTWVSNSPSSAFIFNSTKDDEPRGVFGRLERVRTWDSNNDIHRLELVDGEQYEDDPNNRPDRIDVREVDVETGAPPPGDTDPADRWRARVPYDAWATTLPFDVVTVDPPDTGDDGGGVTSGTAVGIAAAVVVVIAILVFFVRRRRPPTAPPPDAPRQPARDGVRV